MRRRNRLWVRALGGTIFLAISALQAVRWRLAGRPGLTQQARSLHHFNTRPTCFDEGRRRDR